MKTTYFTHTLTHTRATPYGYYIHAHTRPQYREVFRSSSLAYGPRIIYADARVHLLRHGYGYCLFLIIKLRRMLEPNVYRERTDAACG